MTMPATQPHESLELMTVALSHEHDVVLARRCAREIAASAGFDAQGQVRFTTAVSELARNALQYARGGRVIFSLEREGERSLLVARVRDDGPGIGDLPRILQGSYVSRTGMGLGITGARRLSDRFAIESSPGSGTTVAIAKVIAHGPRLDARDAARIVEALAKAEPATPSAELQRQNQELTRTLELLRAREADVERVTQELAETNSGVVALYAELDERAAALQRMSETKTRFLSDMSHELRTPLTSIINLARLLLSHVDGPLAPEQEKQVGMMQRSAESLAEMVNDLLDIAKIEAGKVDLRIGEVGVDTLFAALRGMFQPLVSREVALVLVDPEPPVALFTDERRVAQVLRNFISNALKFTQAGEVRVTAVVDAEGVRFTVADTGIGIDPADHERIFQDFTQVDSPIQRRVRGTGLGLPLTRKLAALLGGRVELESAVGVGSRFSLVVPLDLRRKESWASAGRADG
jgi:signal transduction histidine kinase